MPNRPNCAVRSGPTPYKVVTERCSGEVCGIETAGLIGGCTLQTSGSIGNRIVPPDAKPDKQWRLSPGCALTYIVGLSFWIVILFCQLRMSRAAASNQAG